MDDLAALSWFARARLAIARARAGRPGDFALLKADLFGARAYPQAVEQMGAVRGYRPKIDLSALAAYPAETFGRAYADWMIGRGLKPLEVSKDLDAIADRNTFAVRYAVTHDMFHVLTGFDTSLAGEIGVLAFAEAQDYAPAQKTALAVAAVLYPMLAPWSFRRIARAKSKGRAMGRRADFLLGARLEDQFTDCLEVVRTRFNIKI